MHRKRPCKICTWRNAVLPDPDSPVSDCHTPMNEMHESDRSDLNIALMADMHTKPNQKRMEVLSTQKLEAGCFIAGHDGRKWFRLPTRSMCPLARTPTNAVRQCLQQEGRKSMLEDDASANVEPSSHPKARSRIPPAPAASSQHVAEADGPPEASSSSSSAALHPPAPTHRAVHAAPAHMALTRIKSGSRGRYPPPLMDWISHGITNWIYSDPDPFVSHF